MKERPLVIILNVKSIEPIRRVRTAVLCDLAKRTESPPVYIVERILVTDLNQRPRLRRTR